MMNKNDPKQLKDVLIRFNTRSSYVQADVTNENDVEDLITTTMDQFGHIDILVNNAGTAVRKTLLETTVNDYDMVMNTNLKGVFLCMKYFLMYRKSSKRSKMINISSGPGLYGIPELSVYSASKSGIISLTQSVSKEVENVDVYALCPGSVDTGLYRSLYSEMPRPELKPEDIALKVIELCLPESKVSSGSVIEL
ncbi:SDR family oxidoreductase [Methanosalsum natronophilum]|uniref:SDR family oxidoreductase n=1 Tax=Methanosalsum natronophilum TaxID=768733 RepID=A0A3R8CCH7_9EURY|nr:SDR family oxidoreductase [Methanosalsum natronophilum]MCS3924949.1 3-oxoacyl-[acyl-carrier protein] reductase [Methanosalsum natronophilum]RQD85196.1 MAG: SDR family oxidoreductase [Methanosalsum natronophilum]